MQKKGILYIVATPIGNLNDISSRALEVLRSVSVIACEDTRHSKRLLMQHGIDTKLISYHEHNEQQQLNRILHHLNEGKNVALISDAGTPLISDPGYILVKQTLEQEISVVPIPGACALVCALSASGLPTNQFIFEGFLPAKAIQRQKLLESLKTESRTLIFYEAPHRIIDSITALQEIFGGDRFAVIAKELTKQFETIKHDTLDNLLKWLMAKPEHRLGEFVILVKGFERAKEQMIDAQTQHILKCLLEELPVKQAAHLAAKITGFKKNELYKLALNLDL